MLALVGIAPDAFADDVVLTPRASTSQATELVSVTDVDLQTHIGRLLHFADDGIRPQGIELIPWKDLLALDFPGRLAAPIARMSGVIQLANGDRWGLTPTELDDERVVSAWSNMPNMPSVTMPIETIRSIVFDIPSDADTRDRLFRELTGIRSEKDLILLKNGDRFAGELLGLESDRFRLDTGLGPTQIPRNSVRAIVFNAELISFPRQSDRQLRIVLSDGSRVTVRAIRWDTNQLVCETPFAVRLTFDVARIVSIRWFGAGIVELTSLQPAEYECTPYLSESWPLHADSSVLGNPLRLRGIEYARGLGLHSGTRVSYDLKGQYGRFYAVVGIDDETSGRGNAVFRISLDGRDVWTSGSVSGTQQPIPTGKIDVSDAQRLTLSVDFGEGGNVQDHADWCNPVLIK